MDAPPAGQRASAGVRVHIGLTAERDDGRDDGTVLMPEQQRLIELRGLDVVAGRELLELAVETRHGRLQVRERLARVGARLEAVTQRIELVRDLLRIGL